MWIDVTEQPIERQKKDNAGIIVAKRSVTPKKRKVVADLSSGTIMATAFASSSQHDFQLFKDSQCALSDQICALTDAGYQGLASIHSNCQTPAKKSKLHPLTQD